MGTSIRACKLQNASTTPKICCSIHTASDPNADPDTKTSRASPAQPHSAPPSSAAHSLSRVACYTPDPAPCTTAGTRVPAIAGADVRATVLKRNKTGTMATCTFASDGKCKADALPRHSPETL